MRKVTCRLKILTLLLVACVGVAFGEDLTVTVTIGGVKDKPNFQGSLEAALSNYLLQQIEGIEISAGYIQDKDWVWLQANKERLDELKRFVVTEDVESVASLPDYTGISYFGNSIEEVRIPNMSLIPSHAFRHCRYLKIVDLPDAKYIGLYAFDGCSSLIDLSLPKVVRINDFAFESCISLQSVELPMAKDIGNLAFRRCHQLEHVSLPLVIQIGSKAFLECTKLSTMRLGATPPYLMHSFGEDNINPFSDCRSRRLLTLVGVDGKPLSKKNLYAAIAKYKAHNEYANGKWAGWNIVENP